MTFLFDRVPVGSSSSGAASLLEIYRQTQESREPGAARDGVRSTSTTTPGTSWKCDRPTGSMYDAPSIPWPPLLQLTRVMMIRR